VPLTLVLRTILFDADPRMNCGRLDDTLPVIPFGRG
jgi:hypothetical protein